MKPAEIKVGKTYLNRGAGRTRRIVLAIGDEHRPKEWSEERRAPSQPGVYYEHHESGVPIYRAKTYLRSFASWAGKDCGYVNREQAV